MKKLQRSAREQQFAVYLQQRGINTAHDARYRAGIIRAKFSEWEKEDIYAINDLSEIKRICEKYDDRKYHRYDGMSNAAINAYVTVAGHYPDFMAATLQEYADSESDSDKVRQPARDKIAGTDFSVNNPVITCYGLWWRLNKANLFRSKRMTCYGHGDKPFNMYHQKGIYVLYDVRHPVYVGQSVGDASSIGERLKKHTTDHLADQWDRFSWFGICPVDANGKLGEPGAPFPAQLLNALEGLLITILNPEQNRKIGEGWLREVTQFYQE